jgi:type 1 glutamine amidotransferase
MNKRERRPVMKKIYMLMEDKWHPRDVILAGMEAALGRDGFVAATDPEEIPWSTLAGEAAVFISQKGENQELPDGSKFKWITPEREKFVWDFVNGGGGALFIHCGTVLDDSGEKWFRMSGGTFLHHPEQLPVTYVPIKGSHPIVEGVEPFTVPDEHYHCEIRVKDISPFMIGGSEKNPGILTGWAQEIGKGRTAALTPGHTIEAAANPNMARLIRNAVKWVSRG